MNSIKKTVAMLALIGAASGANAFTLNTPDGNFDLGSWDWDASGTAAITGYDLTAANAAGESDTFNLKMNAFAANLKDSANTTLSTPNLRLGTGSGYEYTVYVNLNERGTVLQNLSPTTSNVLFEILSGTYEIWYQAVGDANMANGTGFRNGTLLLAGNILSSAAGSDFITGLQGLTNPGNITLAAGMVGDVTSQDLSLLAPDAAGVKASTTLQFGDNATVAPSSCVDGVCTTPNNANWYVQADANSSLRKIPEPSSLALLGLSLLGLGAGRRRAGKK